MQRSRMGQTGERAQWGKRQQPEGGGGGGGGAVSKRIDTLALPLSLLSGEIDFRPAPFEEGAAPKEGRIDGRRRRRRGQCYGINQSCRLRINLGLCRRGIEKEKAALPSVSKLMDAFSPLLSLSFECPSLSLLFYRPLSFYPIDLARNRTKRPIQPFFGQPIPSISKNKLHPLTRPTLFPSAPLYHPSLALETTERASEKGLFAKGGSPLSLSLPFYIPHSPSSNSPIASPVGQRLDEAHKQGKRRNAIVYAR